MKYTTISFPGLGIEWNPGRALQLGPLTFNYYGMIIAFGMILAMIYAWKRAKQFGIKSDDLTDGVLCIVPFADCSSAAPVALPAHQEPLAAMGRCSLPRHLRALRAENSAILKQSNERLPDRINSTSPLLYTLAVLIISQTPCAIYFKDGVRDMAGTVFA